MTNEAKPTTDELVSKFVKIYHGIPDFELEPKIHPPLWFFGENSLLNDLWSKKEAANYFLVSASLQDTQLMGNCRNARILLDYLHREFPTTLYEKTDPEDEELIRAIGKWESEMPIVWKFEYDEREIAKVLAGVNSFLCNEAKGDILTYANTKANNGESLEKFADRLSTIYRMGRGKVWLYLRWMVRGDPDLDLFSFSARDLVVPLTTHVLRVVAALDLVSDDLVSI